ncbi:MAG: alpha/beta fold hydrolase [Candidatus Hadarchaeales archaeon]
MQGEEVEVGGLQAIFCPAKSSRKGCVIMCHGLFGSMHSPKYVELAEELQRRGLSSLRFNQRSGERGKEATLTQRMEDLGRVVDFAHSLGYKRIGLMGSSLGGYMVLLLSSLYRDFQALAAWATPYNLGGLQGEELKELIEDSKKYPLIEYIRGVKAPLLLLHGTEDELVPPYHSLVLFERAPPPKVLVWVEGADHRFTQPEKRRIAVEVTAEWLERKLGP